MKIISDITRKTNLLNYRTPLLYSLVNYYCVTNATTVYTHKDRSKYLIPLRINPGTVSTQSPLKFNDAVHFSTSLHRFGKAKDRGKDKKKKSNAPLQINMTEMSEVVDVEKMTSNMEKAIEDLKNHYMKNLTLRSSIGSIEQVPVTFDGQEYTLQELAQIARKPKTVVLNVSGFPQSIPQILQALSKTGMNLNPQQDGTSIFIPIPKVTKEHRENLSKNAKALFIKCRDHIKDIQNSHIRKLKGKTDVSEDLIHRVQNQIEAMASKYIGEAEHVLQTKQNELLGSE